MLILDLRGIRGTARVLILADSISSVRLNRLVALTGGARWSIGSFFNLDGAITVDLLEPDTLPTGFTGVGEGATYATGDVMLNQQSILTGIDYQIRCQRRSRDVRQRHASARCQDQRRYEQLLSRP